MQKKKKVIATVLTAAMAMQAISVPAVAYEGQTGQIWAQSQILANQNVTLKSGKTYIPKDATPEEVRQILFDALVVNPDGIDAQSLNWEFYGKSTFFNKRHWTDVLKGADWKEGMISYHVNPLQEQPLGDYKVRIAGTADDVTLTLKELDPAPYVRRDPIGTVKIAVNEDLSRKNDEIYNSTFDAVIASSDVILNDEKTSIQYYGTATTGAVGNLGKNWVPLEGGKVDGLTYPAVPEGKQKVRISWSGNNLYAPTVIEAEVEFKDRAKVIFTEKNPGTVYEAGMLYFPDQSFDYEKTAEQIYQAIVDSAAVTLEDGTETVLGYKDMEILYNTDKTGITDQFKPLNEKAVTDALNFGLGEWEIRISCKDTVAYRGNHIDVKVNMVDSRIVSSVLLKEGVSFTYHRDPAVMKQILFEQGIDWENSTLPARETLSLDDFVLEYKGNSQLTENMPVLGWAPIEGGHGTELTNSLLTYPKMGAGEKQEVRISYKGNGEYRPSAAGNGVVDVLKAKVKVRVGIRSMYAGEEIPARLININPKDPTIEVYTLYTGTTSELTSMIYLDLPDKFTENKLLIKVIDPIAKEVIGKSFTEILKEGTTLGELRKLLNSEELLGVLKALNVDTSGIEKLLDVLNRMPNLTDNIRVALGTPNNNAGLYTVTAITDSNNYKTAVGIGSLHVKKNIVGTKITWNQKIEGPISKTEAQNFDFSATLSHNGDTTVEQNLHYLYTGFTEYGSPYSSRKAPNMPGRYVMTVVTLGGNYTAAPLTRSFRIKTDEMN